MSCNKKMYFILIIATTYLVNQILADMVKGILLGSLIASKYDNNLHFIPMPYYDYLMQMQPKKEEQPTHSLQVLNQLSDIMNGERYSITEPSVTSTTKSYTTTTRPTTTTTKPTTSTTTPSTTTTTTPSTTTTTNPKTTSSSTTSTTSAYDYAKDLVMVVLRPQNVHKRKPYQTMPESLSADFENWLLNEIASETLNQHQTQDGIDDSGVMALDLSEVQQFEPSYLNKH